MTNSKLLGKLDHIEYAILVAAVIILVSCTFLGLYTSRLHWVSTVANATSTMTQDNFARVPTLDIVQAIAAIMAAVFAIAFGLSQFIVPSIAEKYSPRMLVLFKRNPSYVAAYLLVFLSMFLSVSSLLFIESLNEWSKFWTAVGLMSLFMFGLVAFSFYYSYIYRVADPLEFCSTMEHEILSSLHDVDEVRNGAAALADSAVKAINRRGEQANVKAFLDSLDKVALELIQIWKQSRNESIWPSIESVFIDVSRVYQAAEMTEDTDITNYAILKIRRIGVSLVAGQ